jgi:hypothetical protein
MRRLNWNQLLFRATVMTNKMKSTEMNCLGLGRLSWKRSVLPEWHSYFSSFGIVVVCVRWKSPLKVLEHKKEKCVRLFEVVSSAM